MAQTLLLPSSRYALDSTGAEEQPTSWQIANLKDGLCVPSSGGPYNTLADCQRFARPLHRQLRWNVVNSSGYGPHGEVVGECRPTLDPSGQFADGLTCASSALANYSAYPDIPRAKGWICTNPSLGICEETSNVGVPFSYKVYRTHQECISDPANHMDTAVAMGALPAVRPQEKWYIDSTANRCGRSYLESAPFNTVQQCQHALHQCNNLGQPTLQFSNPVQAQDDRLVR